MAVVENDFRGIERTRERKREGREKEGGKELVILCPLSQDGYIRQTERDISREDRHQL